MRPTRLMLVSVLVTLGLLPALMAPASAHPAAARIPGVMSSDHGSPAARRALEHVQTIFQHKSHAEAQSMVDGGGRDATMAMRDLWLRRNELSGSDQIAAARVLARPGGPARICNSSVCVHYYTTGASAASPAYASQVLNVVTHVYQTYVNAGYRRPVPDGTVGGGRNLVDIYLADVFPMGYYGYCSPDRRPAGQPKGSHIATAYCVLDNDYAGFPGTPLNDLEVTAAHEFFHAVQFAYDYAEDHWLMEGTATWAEDQLYTSINDNLQYLPFGQLRKPRTPLDRSDTLAEYGNWIFFRYLSERIRTKSGALPLVIRRIWQDADSSRGAKHDRYSTWAVTVALRSFHKSFRTMYAGFAAANHHSRTAYREGRANRYPVAPVSGNVRLRPAKKSASGAVKLNHLTSIAQRFTPRKLARKARLRVTVDLRAKRSGAALLTVFRRGGGSTTRWIQVNRAGNGSAAVGFNPRQVTSVLLTIANTGTAFRCKQGTVYSCQGVPKQDGLVDRWTARVV